MGYRIKYYYETGNSFGKHDEEGILEAVWEKLSVAKIALKRIKEHYKWLEQHAKYENYSHIYKDMEKPEPPEWWNVKSEFSPVPKELINLPLDNGKDWQFWPPWCGYFETLYVAEIITEDPEEDDMRITVNDM